MGMNPPGNTSVSSALNVPLKHSYPVCSITYIPLWVSINFSFGSIQCMPSTLEDCNPLRNFCIIYV